MNKRAIARRLSFHRAGTGLPDHNSGQRVSVRGRRAARTQGEWGDSLRSDQELGLEGPPRGLYRKGTSTIHGRGSGQGRDAHFLSRFTSAPHLRSIPVTLVIPPAAPARAAAFPISKWMRLRAAEAGWLPGGGAAEGV